MDGSVGTEKKGLYRKCSLRLYRLNYFLSFFIFIFISFLFFYFGFEWEAGVRKGNDLRGILNGVESNGRTELELDGFFFFYVLVLLTIFEIWILWETAGLRWGIGFH